MIVEKSTFLSAINDAINGNEAHDYKKSEFLSAAEDIIKRKSGL